MDRKTEWKFSIIPTKTDYWYRRLDLLNNETGEVEKIGWTWTLRETYEFLRAFYKGLEVANYIY